MFDFYQNAYWWYKITERPYVLYCRYAISALSHIIIHVNLFTMIKDTADLGWGIFSLLTVNMNSLQGWFISYFYAKHVSIFVENNYFV